MMPGTMPRFVDCNSIKKFKPKKFSELGVEIINDYYASVAWGIVPKNEKIVLAERIRKDDPKRHGELVIPGGLVEPQEVTEVCQDKYIVDYIRRADLEFKEETGAKTKGSGKLLRYNIPHPIYREREEAISMIEPNGNIWVRYKDTHKVYCCHMVQFEGCGKLGKGKADARRPRWVGLEEAVNINSKLTAACRTGVELFYALHNNLPLAVAGDRYIDAKSPLPLKEVIEIQR